MSRFSAGLAALAQPLIFVFIGCFPSFSLVSLEVLQELPVQLIRLEHARHFGVHVGQCGTLYSGLWDLFVDDVLGGIPLFSGQTLWVFNCVCLSHSSSQLQRPPLCPE